MDEKSVKCPRCKCFRYPSNFLKESRQLKTCIKCRENSAKFRSINLCNHNKQKYNCKECNGCPHDKLKYHCKDCGGGYMCVHGKRKDVCKECSKGSFCEHGRRKHVCKECGDPFKIIIKAWILSCRRSDKNNGRFNPDQFIDTDFLRGLLEDYEHCFYNDCKVKFEYVEHNHELVTIERINNNIGHIKSNCVLACMGCNLKKKSNATTN